MSNTTNNGGPAFPVHVIRDIANGLNGVSPKLGQWQRDLMLARAVESVAVAAERERRPAVGAPI